MLVFKKKLIAIAEIYLNFIIYMQAFYLHYCVLYVQSVYK